MIFQNETRSGPRLGALWLAPLNFRETVEEELGVEISTEYFSSDEESGLESAVLEMLPLLKGHFYFFVLSFK